VAKIKEFSFREKEIWGSIKLSKKLIQNQKNTLKTN